MLGSFNIFLLFLLHRRLLELPSPVNTWHHPPPKTSGRRRGLHFPAGSQMGMAVSLGAVCGRAVSGQGWLCGWVNSTAPRLDAGEVQHQLQYLPVLLMQLMPLTQPCWAAHLFL